MKGPLDRTKVVLRHLPPSLSQSSLMEQVDARFAGRYNWVSFRPGKSRLGFTIFFFFFFLFGDKPNHVRTIWFFMLRHLTSLMISARWVIFLGCRCFYFAFWVLRCVNGSNNRSLIFGLLRMGHLSFQRATFSY